MQTLDAVRKAAADAGSFFGTPNFDVWKNFCGPRPNEFVTPLRSSFHKLVLERRKACENYYIGCNKANRQTQIKRSREDTAAAGISAALADKDTGSGQQSVLERKIP